jgi:hypothetical protein
MRMNTPLDIVTSQAGPIGKIVRYNMHMNSIRGADPKRIWVRTCASFEEERRADREFWAQISPDERVAIVEQLREQLGADFAEGQPGLRRVFCVLESPQR